MCLDILKLYVTIVALTMQGSSAMIRHDNQHQYGASTETIEQHWKHLSEGNFNCHFKRHAHNNEMSRHYVRNKTVTCNDGSPSGYYLRRSISTSAWLIYLDGGWFCHDIETCKARMSHTPILMSSKFWPPTRTGSGILSTQQIENPIFHDANIVYVPYCSSDAWSGSHHPREKGDFAFLGSLILEYVIRDLLHIHDLNVATKMYLAGSSAGGTGVLINLDRVAGLMSALAPRVEVRGIVDSGWFLDNQQYKRTQCEQFHTCAPAESIQRGMLLWGGVLPVNCLRQYGLHELWRCYFGYRIYPTLKTPVFVIQHLFDEAQILVDNVGTPVRKEQWQYIQAIGQDMRNTLSNVSAVFAPACLSHILLTRSEWLTVSIAGVTLPEAIDCWARGTNERNLYSRKASDKSNIMLAERLITGDAVKRPRGWLSDAPDVASRTILKEKHHSQDSGDQSERMRSKKRLRLKRQRERRRREKQKEREQRRKEKMAIRERQREERKALQNLAKPQSKATRSRQTTKSKTKSNRRHNLYMVSSPETEFTFDISAPKTANRETNRRASGHDDQLEEVQDSDVNKNRKPVRTTSSSGSKKRNNQRTRNAQSSRETRSDRERPTRKNNKNIINDGGENLNQSQRNSKVIERSFRTDISEGRLKRSLTFDQHDVHHMEAHENSCNHHRIDHCMWPQCNPKCPKYYHPLTSAEMDFMDLFMQFGLGADTLNLEGINNGDMSQDLLLSLIFNNGK